MYPEREEGRPEFVQRLIAQLESGPKKESPGSIWRYDYKGNVVFYVPPSCCDVPSALYDQNGNVICVPDGGIAGDGDGRCPDFFQVRTDESRIWIDRR